MNKKEIIITRCKKASTIKVIHNELTTLPISEQECHLNIIREDNMIYVDCSHQCYINDFMNSEFFTLTEILVSTNASTLDHILEIKGTMEEKGITINKKKRILSESEKKIISERLMKGKRASH
jgi:hypothetical protein